MKVATAWRSGARSAPQSPASRRRPAVRSIAQYIYVLQGGRVQEHAATERLFAAPAAAYTRRLLAAVLEPEVSRGSSIERG